MNPMQVDSKVVCSFKDVTLSDMATQTCGDLDLEGDLLRGVAPDGACRAGYHVPA